VPFRESTAAAHEGALSDGATTVTLVLGLSAVDVGLSRIVLKD
jgi:hypothetical protein